MKKKILTMNDTTKNKEGEGSRFWSEFAAICILIFIFISSTCMVVMWRLLHQPTQCELVLFISLLVACVVLMLLFFYGIYRDQRSKNQPTEPKSGSK